MGQAVELYLTRTFKIVIVPQISKDINRIIAYYWLELIDVLEFYSENLIETKQNKAGTMHLIISK